MTWRAGSAFRQAGWVATLVGLMAGSAWAATPAAQDFSSFLVEGYGQMAQAGQGANDPRQPYFHERAALAARGEGLLPIELDKRFLDSWTLREADFARRQLIHRLDAGARQKQALLAAIAQVNFDCWAAPLPSQFGARDRDECRRRFYFAFAGLAPSGGDLLPGGSPDGASGSMATASAGQKTSRTLIHTPAIETANAGRAGRLASASIALGGSQQIECDGNGQNCVAVAFTGPAADALIHELRNNGLDNGGADNAGSSSADASRGEGIAGNAEAAAGNAPSSDSTDTSSPAASDSSSSSNSTSPGNGKGKGKGHGNGHGNGKGPG